MTLDLDSANIYYAFALCRHCSGHCGTFTSFNHNILRVMLLFPFLIIKLKLFLLIHATAFHTLGGSRLIFS